VTIFAARAISNTVLHATAAAGEVSFDTVSKMVSRMRSARVLCFCNADDIDNDCDCGGGMMMM
jgi:hypothetical protein